MSKYEIDGIVVADLRIVDTDRGPMVGCTLVLDGKLYECNEYFDTGGYVDDSTDSHMSVNGIFNLQTRKMEPVFFNGMERADFGRWVDANNVLRGVMQAFVTNALFPESAAA